MSSASESELPRPAEPGGSVGASQPIGDFGLLADCNTAALSDRPTVIVVTVPDPAGRAFRIPPEDRRFRTPAGGHRENRGRIALRPGEQSRAVLPPFQPSEQPRRSDAKCGVGKTLPAKHLVCRRGHESEGSDGRLVGRFECRAGR